MIRATDAGCDPHRRGVRARTGRGGSARAAARAIPPAGRSGRLAPDLPRRPVAGRPAEVRACRRRGRTRRLGRARRAGPLPRGRDLGVVRRAAARADGAAGRRAARRDLDAQHAHGEPPPAAGVVLPARRADGRSSSSMRPTFPSDRYAVESQLIHHGLDPAEHLVVVGPRDGESIVRTEDLEAAIHEHRDTLAVALLAGVNYATGPGPRRRSADGRDPRGRGAGRLATRPLGRQRAAGPARLGRRLRDVVHVQVPVRGARIHRPDLRQSAGTDRIRPIPRLSGWFGNALATRFRMAETFDPELGRRRLADVEPADPRAGAGRAPRSRSSTRSGCRPCARSRSG